MDIFSKRSPNIRTLQCFVAVARELNFRRAAEVLNMSQPPLSRHIQSLENTLRVKLIQRNTHNVRLTGAGEIFAKEAHAILISLGTAVETLRGVKAQTDDVRLGLTSIIDFSLLPRIQAVLSRTDFAAKHCQERAYSKQLVERVRSGRLDFAIVGDIVPPSDGVTVHRIDYHPMMVVMPASHPAAHKVRIAFSDLCDTTLLWFSRTDNPAYYDKCERVFAAHGYYPQRRFEPPEFTLLLAHVAADEGVAFCPASMRAASREGVVYRSFDPEIERSLTIDVQLIVRAGESRREVLERVDAMVSAAAT